MNKEIPKELKPLLKKLLKDEEFRRYTIETYGCCPKDENDTEGFEKLFSTEVFKKEKEKALKDVDSKLDETLNDLMHKLRMRHLDLENDFSSICRRVSKAMGDATPRMVIKVYSNRAELEAKQPDTGVNDVDSAIVGASAMKAIKAALSAIPDDSVKRFTLQEVMKEMEIELD